MEEFINLSRVASIDQLCAEFNVSVNTVRRDLAELVKLGKIKKVYGGVMSNAFIAQQRSANSPYFSYNDRIQMEISAKKAIAREAAKFVEDNAVIFIDAGTTTINILPYFKDTYNVTVVTYCIPTIAELSKLPNLQVLIPPGKLLHNSLSIVGAQTEEWLSNIVFDKAFMACTGITSEFVLTTSHSEELAVKRLVMSVCKENILMADRTKFEKRGLFNYGRLNEFQKVISDRRLSDPCMRYLLENEIEFIEAK